MVIEDRCAIQPSAGLHGNFFHIVKLQVPANIALHRKHQTTSVLPSPSQFFGWILKPLKCYCLVSCRVFFLTGRDVPWSSVGLEAEEQLSQWFAYKTVL